KAGEAVRREENLVDLETDKVVLEVPAPADGVLKQIIATDGAVVTSGQLLAVLEPGEGAAAAPAAAAPPAPAAPAPKPQAAAPKPQPAGAPAPAPAPAAGGNGPAAAGAARPTGTASASKMGPAVRKLVEEHDLDPA